MTDREKENSRSDDECSRHLEESVSSGRISRVEADVIKRYFAGKRPGTWPASSLQRRMQDSGA